MLHKIIQTKRGKEEVKMIDSLPKCNNRIKELRSSYRGDNSISFRIEKAEETDKFEAKPLGGSWKSGSYGLTPSVIRKGKSK